MATTKPLIRFEVPDSVTRIVCPCGNNTFNLEVKVRMQGALVTRVARCTKCDHTEGID